MRGSLETQRHASDHLPRLPQDVVHRTRAQVSEYALIAAAVAAVITGGYKVMFGKLNTFVSGVTFSS